MDLIGVLAGVKNFEREAASIFEGHEAALATRAYHATESLRKVSHLTFAQADALKQAVRCVEAGLYRAAFVMAWTAIADLILEVAIKETAIVSARRPTWSFTDKTSLAEERSDYAIVLALKESGILSKGKMKSLHGMLHRRNECSHPSTFHPGPNEALGFIDECIATAKSLHDLL